MPHASHTLCNGLNLKYISPMILFSNQTKQKAKGQQGLITYPLNSSISGLQGLQRKGAKPSTHYPFPIPSGQITISQIKGSNSKKQKNNLWTSFYLVSELERYLLNLHDSREYSSFHQRIFCHLSPTKNHMQQLTMKKYTR